MSIDYYLTILMFISVAFCIVMPAAVVVELWYKGYSRLAGQIELYLLWVKYWFLDFKEFVWTVKYLAPLKWLSIAIYGICMITKYIGWGLGWLALTCIKSWCGWIVPKTIIKTFESIEYKHIELKQDLCIAIASLVTCYIAFSFLIMALPELPDAPDLYINPPILIVTQSLMGGGVALIAVWIYRIVNELYMQGMKNMYMEAGK